MRSMLRFLALLSALCLLSQAAPAAITLVTSTSVRSVPDVDTSITTPAFDDTGANLDVVFVTDYASFSGTLVNSKGSACTKLTTTSYAGRYGALYYCPNATVGSGHTFTYSPIAHQASIFVLAFSGATVTPFDTEAVANNNGTSQTSLATGSISPAGSGELFVTGLATAAGTGFAADSSFSTPVCFTGNPAVDYIAGCVSYKISSSAENPTWSWSSNQPAAAAIANFKAPVVTSSPFIFHPFP